MTPCFRALAKIAGSTGYQLILIVETSGEPRQVHQNVARPRRPKLPPPAGQGMFSNVTASFWPHPRQDFGTVGQPATDQTIRPKFERYGRTAMSLAGWALPGRKKVMNPVDPGAIVPPGPVHDSHGDGDVYSRLVPLMGICVAWSALQLYGAGPLLVRFKRKVTLPDWP